MALQPLVTSLPVSERKHRRPKHKFQLRQRPYAIVPSMIAPVLPGESFVSHYTEAREITAPIKNSIIGWKSEFMLFYVKIMDLAERDQLDDLFIAPTQNLTGLHTTADTAWYHRGGTVNFTQLAVKRITEVYFRDDGEAFDAATLGSYPMAAFKDFGAFDSLTADGTLFDGPALGADQGSQDRLMDAYEMLRSMGLADFDYETYLRTFGVRIAKEQVRKPQMLDAWGEFQYPSNTVDPSTGVPSSAVSWVHKRSGRAQRSFLQEPGFIVGVHVVRPKVYLGRQFGSVAHHMDTGMSWLPAMMADQPETSLREFTAGATGNGPLSNGTAGPTGGYWVDMRDLFLYGDQLVNFGLTETDANIVGLPTAALNMRYPSSADVDALFSSAIVNTVRVDGYTSLDILGRQTDHTPTTSIDLR